MSELPSPIIFEDYLSIELADSIYNGTPYDTGRYVISYDKNARTLTIEDMLNGWCTDAIPPSCGGTPYKLVLPDHGYTVVDNQLNFLINRIELLRLNSGVIPEDACPEGQKLCCHHGCYCAEKCYDEYYVYEIPSVCEFEPMNCCPEGTQWDDSAHECRPLIGGTCEARGYRTAANGECEIFRDDEIERLLRGERIAPSGGTTEMSYDAARNVLIVYRTGTDVVLAEQSLDDPKLDPRFQVFKEAAQPAGGMVLAIAAAVAVLLLSNRN